MTNVTYRVVAATPGTDPAAVGGPDEHRDVRRLRNRFTTLPAHVPVKDMVETTKRRPEPDPQMGRDTETDFMLRNAGVIG